MFHSYNLCRLRVPIWVTDLQFIHEDNHISSGATFVTGTAYKHLRLYDTRINQQPTLSVELMEYRITKLCVDSHHQSVYVGDASGELFCIDLRTFKRSHTLNSSGGSIRDLSISASGDYLLSVSLDRFARVYSTQGNKQITQRYLNSRLNAGVFLREGKKGGKKRKVTNDDNDDDDEGANNSSEEEFDSEDQEDRLKALVFSDEEDQDEDGSEVDQDDDF